MYTSKNAVPIDPYVDPFKNRLSVYIERYKLGQTVPGTDYFLSVEEP